MNIGVHKFYRRVFFSKESYNILNHATLQIGDVEILKLSNQMQAKNLDRLFFAATVIALLNVVLRTLMFLTNENEPLIRILSPFT